jgi:Leucine-rich repeat (LRR) protein
MAAMASPRWCKTLDAEELLPWHLFKSDCHTLVVKHRNIVELPAWLGFARCLRVLDVSHNALKILPAALGLLESLQVLRARDNVLVGCRFDLGQLRELATVDLRKNRLMRLRYSLPHKDVTVMLDDNPVGRLSWGLRNAARISLQNTGCERMAFVDTWEADLTACQVPSLQNLGAKLQHLCVRAAGLRSLEHAADMPLLRTLRADDNPGLDARPPPGALQCLQELQLNRCELGSVPEELLELPALVLLGVCSNDLRRLPRRVPANWELVLAADDNPLDLQSLELVRCRLRLDTTWMRRMAGRAKHILWSSVI